MDLSVGIIIKITLIFVICYGVISEQLTIGADQDYKPCKVENKMLFCDGSNVQNYVDKIVIQNIAPELHGVYFKNWKVTKLLVDYIKCAENIQQLTIESNNYISYIDEYAFRYCNSLVELKISGKTESSNVIALNGLFYQLPKLKIIKLYSLNVYRINEKTFQNQRLLEELYITEKNLSYLSPYAFGVNFKLKKMIISDNKKAELIVKQFENWPDDGFVIESISFHNCYLKTFPQFTVKFGQFIKFLSLSKNPIRTMEKEKTKLLSNLNELILESTNLDFNLVTGLSFLTNLITLNFNDILTLSDLPKEVSQLSKLRKLFLNGLQAAQIQTQLPATIEELSMINLVTNVFINPDFFGNVKNLTYLNINFIKPFDTRFLENARNKLAGTLQTLTVISTQIHLNYLWKFITSLKSVEMLILDNNRIHYIPKEVFDKMLKLKHLSLGLNYINSSFVTSDTFYRLLQRVDIIDLSYNSIQNLPPCPFYGFNQFEKLRLKGNPINCNCKVLWLIEQLRSTKNSGLNFNCKNDGKSFLQLVQNSDSLQSACRLASNVKVSNCQLIIAKEFRYEVKFDGDYLAANHSLMLRIVDIDKLRFLFDYMTISVNDIQFVNATWNRRYSLFPQNLSLSLQRKNDDTEMQQSKYTVCLLLWKGGNDYRWQYNCQIVESNNSILLGRWFVIVGILSSIVLACVIIGSIVCLCRRLRSRHQKYNDIPRQPGPGNVSEDNSTNYSLPEDEKKTQSLYEDIGLYADVTNPQPEIHEYAFGETLNDPEPMSASVMRQKSTTSSGMMLDPLRYSKESRYDKRNTIGRPNSASSLSRLTGEDNSDMNSSMIKSHSKSRFKKQGSTKDKIMKAKSSLSLANFNEKPNQLPLDVRLSQTQINRSNAASLPRIPVQYRSRDLPQPPTPAPQRKSTTTPLKLTSTTTSPAAAAAAAAILNQNSSPPPKPRFPSVPIDVLLSNADRHLKYLSMHDTNEAVRQSDSSSKTYSSDSNSNNSNHSNNSKQRKNSNNNKIEIPNNSKMAVVPKASSGRFIKKSSISFQPAQQVSQCRPVSDDSGLGGRQIIEDTNLDNDSRYDGTSII